MIVEERIYTIAVGKAKEWLDFYEAYGWPVQQRHLGRCIGFFVTEIGPLNKIVHLWAYDDLAHRERARATMMQDPDWAVFVKGTPHVVHDQESRILKPVSFSPLQ
jgi:hypothetical protein